MIERSYRKVNNVYLPLIKIQLANPNDLELNLFEYSLLDTGGSVTIIPYFLIDELFLLPLDERNIITVEGVTKKRIICVPYFLMFSFDYQNFYDSVVYYTPEIELDEIIIGRNILNQFSIKFDGINKKITINP
jgi:predicted aspartyl protease